MMRKWIIWILVLAFFNISIVPDSAFGYFEGGFGSGSHDQGGIVIAGLIIVGVIVLTIASIARSKHQKNPTGLAAEQTDIKMTYEFRSDNKSCTQIPCEISFDNQPVAPSGDIVLVRW